MQQCREVFARDAEACVLCLPTCDLPCLTSNDSLDTDSLFVCLFVCLRVHSCLDLFQVFVLGQIFLFFPGHVVFPIVCLAFVYTRFCSRAPWFELPPLKLPRANKLCTGTVKRQLHQVYRALYRLRIHSPRCRMRRCCRPQAA